MRNMFLSALSLGFVFSSASASAREQHTVLDTTARIGQIDLYCVIEANPSIPKSERLTTVLGGRYSPELSIRLASGAQLMLKHKLAEGKGCNPNRLTEIAAEVQSHFGFAHDVPVRVIQDTTASRINGFGECIANYTETVEINLKGVALKATNADILKQTDCN